MISDKDQAEDAALLALWFGEAGSAVPRDIWFAVDPAFDEVLKQRFGATAAAAAGGDLDGWSRRRDPCLALVLLLDQLPRNLHRGSSRAYASDTKARDVARSAIVRGFDRSLMPVRRSFFYLPFMHSERLADQEESVRLFETLPAGPWADDQCGYARRHRDIIARFGRFPHRNAVLGRPSTAAEIAFLAEPDTAG